MAERDQQAGKAVRVLAVHDDPAIRKMLVEVLSLEGFTVETAVNGQEALALLQELREPCVLLLDDRMPGMGGFAVLETLAARPELADRTGCIFMTGRSRSLPLDLARLLIGFQAPVLS